MENNDEEVNNVDKPKKTAKHDERGAADLERVTDCFEEQELDGDVGFIKDIYASDRSADNKAKQEKRLQKIKVEVKDVDLICKEMEVTKAVAERRLKENQGDIYRTLVDMVKQ